MVSSLFYYVSYVAFLFISNIAPTYSQSTVYCPPEARECEDDMLYLKRGYWRASESVTYIHKCLEYEACGGGNVTGQASCREGYTGPICGICESNYFQAANGSCRGCSGDYILSVLIAGSLMALLVFGFVPCLWMGRVAIKRSCDSHTVKRFSPRKILTALYTSLYKNSSATAKKDAYSAPADSALPPDQGHVQGHVQGGGGRGVDLIERLVAVRLRNIKARLLSKFKIFLTLFQIAALLPFVLHFRYEERGSYSKHLSRISRFTHLTGGLAFECFSSFDYVDLLTVSCAVPLVSAVLLLNIHRIHHLYIVSFFPALRKMTAVLEKLQSEYVWVLLQGLAVVYPAVIMTIFRAFTCQDIDPSDEMNASSSYNKDTSLLRADLSLSCDSKRFLLGRNIAMGMAVVYGAGVPALLWWVLRKRPLSPAAPTDLMIGTFASTIGTSPGGELIKRSKSEVAVSAMKAGGGLSGVFSLCAPYKRAFWYWEIVEYFRKTVFCGLLVLVYQGSSLQIVVGIAAAIGFLKLHTHCQPYLHQSLNIDADIANHQLLFILLLTLVSRADISHQRDDFVSACLVAVLFSSFLVVLWRVLRDWGWGMHRAITTGTDDDVWNGLELGGTGRGMMKVSPEDLSGGEGEGGIFSPDVTSPEVHRGDNTHQQETHTQMDGDDGDVEGGHTHNNGSSS